MERNRERIRHDLRQVQTKFWPRRCPHARLALAVDWGSSSFTGKSRFPGDYFKHGLEFPIRLDFLLFGNGSFDQAGAGVKGEGVGPDFSTANGNDEFSSPLGVQPSRDPGVPSSGGALELADERRADFLGVPPMAGVGWRAESASNGWTPTGNLARKGVLMCCRFASLSKRDFPSSQSFSPMDDSLLLMLSMTN